MTSTFHSGPAAEAGGESVLGPRCKSVSIKDAAQTLGIPAWRIYRMNRANGPLRFARWGRRLFVETSSLATYATELQNRCEEEDMLTSEERVAASDMKDPVTSQANIVECVAVAVIR